MTSDPLSQDGRTAPALVQQGPFLRSLDLRSGQDKLLLKNVQLFGETCGCLWGWQTSPALSTADLLNPP